MLINHGEMFAFVTRSFNFVFYCYYSIISFVCLREVLETKIHAHSVVKNTEFLFLFIYLFAY